VFDIFQEEQTFSGVVLRGLNDTSFMVKTELIKYLESTNSYARNAAPFVSVHEWSLLSSSGITSSAFIAEIARQENGPALEISDRAIATLESN